MIYLLDTNSCIRLINRRSIQLRDHLVSVPAADIVVCSIVEAELFARAAKSQTPVQTLAKQQQFLQPFRSLPFGDAEALVYSHIRADLERAGTPIGAMDMLIAAIALANNLTLVTNNTREFSRIADLRLVDWEQP